MIRGETKGPESCGYCQGVLDADSVVAECSICSIKQHRECWDEYGGCVLPGCTGHDKLRPLPEDQPATQVVLMDESGEIVAQQVAPKAPASRGAIAVLIIAALVFVAALVAVGILFLMNGS